MPNPQEMDPIDQFAMAALTGIMASGRVPTSVVNTHSVASSAYELARAMMNEAAKPINKAYNRA